MKHLTLKKLKNLLVGVGVLCLTVIYILASAVVAQENQNGKSGYNYSPDYLSWGDVYAFDEAAFTGTNYGKTPNIPALKFYNQTVGSTSTVTWKQYAGKITFNEHAEPTNQAPIRNNFKFTEFYNGVKASGREAPIGYGVTIPVMQTTSGTGVYSVVPGSTGTYRVYVYSESEPTGVTYALLSSYTKATTEGNSLSELTFTRVGETNWYYGEISVQNTGWTALSPKCQQTTTKKFLGSSANGQDTYDGGKIQEGAILAVYYKNAWSVNTVTYDTVLTISFPSNVELGPITKCGDTVTVSNSDDTKGTATIRTVFGEEVASGAVVPHMPVFLQMETLDSQYTFSITGASPSQNYENGTLLQFDYESALNIQIGWEKLVQYPIIQVTGGALTEAQLLSFYLTPEAETTFPIGESEEYTFNIDFTGVEEGMTLKYTIDGGAEQTLTGDGSFSVPADYDPVTVTFVAMPSGSDSKKTIVYTIRPDESTKQIVATVGSREFRFLEDALVYVNTDSSSTNLIYLNESYEMHVPGTGKAAWNNETVSGYPDGFSIPSGKTLILRHSGSATYTSEGDHPYTYKTTEKNTNAGNGAKPGDANTDLTLTFPEGGKLYISGIMSIGGNINGLCLITGHHADVKLNANASIEVESGGILASLGFIYGDGAVTAQPGGTIYVPFAIIDFKGGGYTVGAAGRMGSIYGVKTHPSGESYVSPFTRYTMNAIQCDFILKPTSTLRGYVDLYAGDDHNASNALFIANTGDPLIKTNNNTEIRIQYDSSKYSTAYPYVGKTTMTIKNGATYGNLKITLNVKFTTATINTNQLAFPVPYNFDIILEEGDYTIPYNLMLLPGSRLTVEKGATLNVKSSLTVYDGLHDYCNLGVSKEDTTGSSLVLKDFKGLNTTADTYTAVASSSGYLYPTTSDLRGVNFQGSGSADLIVNGTLNLETGAKFGGVVQTASTDASIKTGNITCETTTQVGLTGQYSINVIFIKRTYTFVGATVRTLKGEVLDAATGKRTQLAANQKYSPSVGADTISSYDYTVYYATDKGTLDYIQDLTEEVDCHLQGSWYNYKVKIHSGTETFIRYFADGADVSDEDYYSDKEFKNHVDKITNGSDLYMRSDVSMEAEVVWADGSGSQGFLTLREAVKAATHAGDRVVLLQDMNNTSVSVSPTEGQDFIFDLNGHTFAYSSMPFAVLNGGKLTVDLNGGTVTNKFTNEAGTEEYSAESLIQVNNEGEFVLDMNGGSMEFTNTSATVDAAIVNAGTLTIKDSKGTGKIYTKTKAGSGIVNTGEITSISGVTLQCDSGYGIKNDGKIGDINCTVTSTKEAIFNSANCQIEKISGGKYRSTTTCALQNSASGTPVTIMSGSGFAGKNNGQSGAIFQWNDTTRQVYETNNTLSATADNGYYFVVPSLVDITWKWLDTDGETVKEETVTVTVGTKPTHDNPGNFETDDCRFTFANWNPSVVTATKNATYEAVYTRFYKNVVIVQDSTDAAVDYYETVTDALAKVQDWQTVRLRKDMTESVTMGTGSAKLDLAGFTISGSITNNGSLSIVVAGTVSAENGTALTNKGTLTICDGLTVKTGNGIALDNSGNIEEIPGGTFQGTTAAIQVSAGGQIETIQGGAFTAGTTGTAAGIVIKQGGTITTIEEGNFSGSSGIDNAGTVEKISGGTFIGKSDESATLTAGVYLEGSGKINEIAGGAYSGKNGILFDGSAVIDAITGGAFTGSVHGIRIRGANAQISKISGGVFTTTSTSVSSYAIAIADGVTGKIQLITSAGTAYNGPKFKSGAGTRENAIQNVDSHCTYSLDGYTLSTKANSAGYFTIVANTFTLVFDVDGRTKKVEDVPRTGDVALNSLYGDAPTKNGYQFDGWTYNGTNIGKETVVQDKLGTPGTGDTVTVYATWNVVYSVTVTWGSLEYDYKGATYVWDGQSMKYKVDKEAHWESVDQKNTVTVENNTVAAEGTVQVKAKYEKTGGYTFDLLENNTSLTTERTLGTVEPKGMSQSWSFLLSGTPSGDAFKATVGKITLTLQPGT